MQNSRAKIHSCTRCRKQNSVLFPSLHRTAPSRCCLLLISRAFVSNRDVAWDSSGLGASCLQSSKEGDSFPSHYYLTRISDHSIICPKAATFP